MALEETPAQPAPQSTQEAAANPVEDLRARMATVLMRDVGARDVKDEKGDLVFYFQAERFVAWFSARDPKYVSLRHYVFYEVPSAIRRPLVSRACLNANRRIKIAKVFPCVRPNGSEYVNSSAEFYVDEPQRLNEELLLRYIELMFAAERAFFESLACPDIQAASMDEVTSEADGALRH